MAIVKAHFTRRRAEIKETLRYIIHRPNKDAEKTTRTLFSNGERELTKEEAYQLIDSLKGSVYFHVILNFHAKREDTRRDLDLSAITRQTFLALEERLARTVRFLAVEHNDHTELRHIHAIAILKLGRGERVGKEDWQAIRKATTEYVRLQRRGLDLFRGYYHDRQHPLSEAKQERVFSERAVSRFPGFVGGRGHYMTLQGHRRALRVRGVQPTRSCTECGHKNQMVRLKDGNHYCRTCGRVQEATQDLELSL